MRPMAWRPARRVVGLRRTGRCEGVEPAVPVNFEAAHRAGKARDSLRDRKPGPVGRARRGFHWSAKDLAPWVNATESIGHPATVDSTVQDRCADPACNVRAGPVGTT